MKVARIYIRVSTREQAIEGFSIQAQEERLINYCKAKDYKVDEIYVDAGFSGSNLDRPAMSKMLNDIKIKDTDVIVVYKLDRISRSQKDTLHLIEDIFLERDISFVSMQESFDTATPFGRAMVGILSVFAQLERENIRERSMIGKEERAKEGLWGGGMEPFGYDYINEMLIPNANSEIIKKAYKLYLEGYGAPTISRKVGGIGRSKIRAWLLAPVYAGKITHNGTIYAGQHEEIISWEDFLKVQEIMTYRSNKRGKPVSVNTLAGLVKCKQCKATYGSRKSGNHTYLVCYSRSGYVPEMIKDKDCRNQNWRLDRLLDLVKNELNEIIYNKSYLDKKVSDRKEENVNIELIESEINTIDRKINKIMDIMLDEDLQIDNFKTKLKELNDKKTVLVNMIKKEETKTHSIVIETINTIQHNWDNLDVAGKNELLRRIIKTIWIDESVVSIDWNF